MASFKETDSKLKTANQTHLSEGDESVQWKSEKEHLTHITTTLKEEMLHLKQHNAALV